MHTVEGSVKLEEDFATVHTQGKGLVDNFSKEQIFPRDKELDRNS